LNDKSDDVKRYAIRKVTDQIFLEDISENSIQLFSDIDTIKSINNQVVLRKIITSNISISKRVVAMECLQNQDFVKEFALESENDEIRSIAVSKLQDQNIIKSIAIDERTDKIAYIPAFVRITDNEFIVLKILKERDKKVCNNVFYHLADQKENVELSKEILESVINDHPSVFVKRNALSNILDDKILLKLESDKSLFDIAVKYKFGQIKDEELSAYDRANGYEFDLITLLSVINDNTSSLSNLVKKIYRELIAFGNSSYLNELCILLNEYGDKDMALDYLNCDHPVLERAATKWAHEHNYNVYKTPGSNSLLKWGSKKK